MAKQHWTDVDPRIRQVIVIVGAFEAGLKVAALIDLAHRPAGAVRGSKRGWAASLLLVGSAGVLPLVYLLRGRRLP